MEKYLKFGLFGLLAMTLTACPPKPEPDPEPADYVETAGSLDLGLSMVYVQGGTFNMGATPDQVEGVREDESPVHSVTLSSYYMGKYEITQAQYKAVMGTNPSYFQGEKLPAGISGSDNLPVEQVTWFEAKEFCEKLSAKTGKKYVLPTEAQWEFAARGGSKTKSYQYSGSNNVDEVAWYMNTSGTSEADRSTHPVGTKNANELGIHDMSGNVWEWCSDWYGLYKAAAVTDPTGMADGDRRVLRGGGWDYKSKSCRVAHRGGDNPKTQLYIRGFRVACLMK